MSVSAIQRRSRSTRSAHPATRWLASTLLATASLVAGVALPLPAAAQAERPVLRVELGVHAAAVRRISSAFERNLVVTASDDKTARVWALDSGELLHVLRPPVGDGELGRLYGVAVHPSEDLVAVGGTTARGSGAHRIYLFSPASGRLLGTIDARGGDIKDLAWSADGSLLLAAYAGANGMRAFDRSGRVVFEDRFDGGSYGLAVAADGRVAASSLDGRVRLYRAAGGAISAERVLQVAGREPVGLAFSPDGSRLVVGFNAHQDTPEIIELASGRSLARLEAPRREAGNLFSVTWSDDGTRLFVGGTSYDRERLFPIYLYDANSGALLGEQRLARDSVFDFNALPGGAVVYASFDGSWGVVDAERSRVRVAGNIPDLRGPTNLGLDARARTAAWTFTNGTEPASFDFDRRVVTLGAGAQTQAPKTRRGLFGGDTWENVRAPKVNGRAVEMTPGEVSRAIAYPPAGDDAFLGTSRALLRIDGSGAITWRVSTEAEIRSINVSADSALLVTGMSDGTLRWWRARDGALLLTLLATRDGRWVVWTPSGYFDASAGADRLVGWAVNRGPAAAADFYSLNRFRADFNRPDVIDRVFETRDLTAAVREANQVVIAALTAPSMMPAQTLPPPMASVAPQQAQPAPAPTAEPPPTAVTPTDTPSAKPEPPDPALTARPPAPPQTSPPPVTTAVRPPAVQDQPLPPPVPAPVAPRTQITAVAPPAEIPSLEPIKIEVDALPPALSALDSTELQAGSGEVSIPFTIRSASTGASVSIEVRVDGRPVDPKSLKLPARFDGKSRALAQLSLPSRESVVQVIARDRFGVSEPLVFRIKGKPAEAAAAAAAATSPGEPRLFVLSVGISRYQREEYQLGLPAKDARDFAAALKRQEGRLYRSVQVRSLTDSEATRDSILAGLQWLASSVGPNDVGMLFLAGHGFNAPDGRYYFMPWEGNHEKLRTTGVSEVGIRDTLRQMRGRALFFFDTCFAGNVIGNLRNASRELARLANDLASAENGVVVFASSSGRQESEEKDEWGNGAFTRALVDGLRGRADLFKTGRITFKGLDAYVSEAVRRLTDGRQTPVTIAPVGVPDFAIARVIET